MSKRRVIRTVQRRKQSQLVSPSGIRALSGSEAPRRSQILPRQPFFQAADFKAPFHYLGTQDALMPPMSKTSITSSGSTSSASRELRNSWYLSLLKKPTRSAPFGAKVPEFHAETAFACNDSLCFFNQVSIGQDSDEPHPRLIDSQTLCHDVVRISVPGWLHNPPIRQRVTSKAV